MKYRLKIKLKQHTPLIHFQYEQAGATVRATELKPKLDKFLIKKSGEIKDKYLIGSEKSALNYKVKIKNVVNQRILDIETDREDRNGRPLFDKRGKKRKDSFPAFFANMGSDSDIKKFSMCDCLTVEIFSFSDDLLNMIKKHFCDFISVTNFGTRQSKGFGSFYIHEGDDLFKLPEMKYHFYGEADSDTEHGEFKQLFESIDVFYRSIRSGINLKHKNNETFFYFKSLMFHYAKSKGIQWDKKTIKEKYFNREFYTQQEEYNDFKGGDILSYSSAKKYLMRDLLGLSSDESWFSYRSNITKTSKTIDRFKSPITFKPIRIGDKHNEEEKEFDFDIFIIPNAVDKKFLNQAFEILRNGRGNLLLHTAPDFNINDFFEFIRNFNAEDHIDEEFENHKYFEILVNAYNDIYNNLKK
jgi:hypothetical protein